MKAWFWRNSLSRTSEEAPPQKSWEQDMLLALRHAVMTGVSDGDKYLAKTRSPS
jgi:hypothetical protein